MLSKGRCFMSLFTSMGCQSHTIHVTEGRLDCCLPRVASWDRGDLVNPKLSKSCLQDLVVIDEVVIILGVKVYLTARTSMFARLSPYESEEPDVLQQVRKP